MIRLRLGWGLFFICFIFSGPLRADFLIAPRYEYITGNQEELANRVLIKSKLNANAGYFGLYFEGFAEFENNKVEAENRRSPHRGYLQEGYVEFKYNSIYLRAGRQALRWSEMWVVPSLDIWTARRWNRLYFDPLSEQLVYPEGVSFSYATQSFSVDLVGVTSLAENTYPEPIEEIGQDQQDKSEASGGARVQFDLGGFHFSGIGAKLAKKYSYGVGANYAWDSAVPKLEWGGTRDETAEPVTEYFAAAGVDIFWDTWILTPQITVFDSQSIYYLSGQKKTDLHDFQFQGFVNPYNRDSFWSLSYSYNLTKNFSLGGFVQDYYGEAETLHWIYRQITGEGLVAGLRLELIGDWAF